MTDDETVRTDTDALMSNLEFFASAPLQMARRALAVAGMIVNGRTHGPANPPGQGHQHARTGARAMAGAPGSPDDGEQEAVAEPDTHAESNTEATKTTALPARVTPEIVHAIRRAYDGTAAATGALADQYKLSADHVGRIATRARWKSVPPEPGEWDQPRASCAKRPPRGARQPAKRLDEKTVQAIRRDYKRVSNKDLAKRHGASTQTIRDIGEGRTHKNLPGENAGPKSVPAKRTGHPDRPPNTNRPLRINGARIKRGAKGRAAEARRATSETDLTEIQVREIRREALTAGRSKETIAKLADEYDVAASTIEAVIEREAWNHLQPRDDEYDPIGQSVWDGRTPLS